MIYIVNYPFNVVKYAMSRLKIKMEKNIYTWFFSDMISHWSEIAFFNFYLQFKKT